MISIDSILFKQVADKFANELIKKYCPDVKLKHSFALEALSHAFNYKDYNTIKPALDDKLSHTSTISFDYSLIKTQEDLIKNGFESCEKFETFFRKGKEKEKKAILDSVFFSILFYYRSADKRKNEKYYCKITPINTSSEIRDEVIASIFCAGACLGTKLHYFDAKDGNIYVYWTGEDDFIVPSENEEQLLKEGTFILSLNRKDKVYSWVVKKIEGEILSLEMIDDNSDDAYQTTMERHEDPFIVCKNSSEAKKLEKMFSSLLWADAAGDILPSTALGLARAKYLSLYQPDVVSFVVGSILGYHLEGF